MSIVLRVSGTSLDVDACLSWIPTGRLTAKWRPGDRSGRRIATTAGFNMLLAEDDEVGPDLASAQAVLEEVAGPLRDLAEHGHRAEVDVALFVEAVAPRSVTFSPEFLAAVSTVRADLRVSAYPTAEE